MNVEFCRSCKGLILPGYRYCPYCGAEARRGPGIEEALGGPFARIEAANAGDRAPAAGNASDGDRALADAAESLDRLEADMDLIMEAIEKEGRSPPL